VVVGGEIVGTKQKKFYRGTVFNIEKQLAFNEDEGAHAVTFLTIFFSDWTVMRLPEDRCFYAESMACDSKKRGQNFSRAYRRLIKVCAHCMGGFSVQKWLIIYIHGASEEWGILTGMQTWYFIQACQDGDEMPMTLDGCVDGIVADGEEACRLDRVHRVFVHLSCGLG
jgi:hypothetical protein